MLNRRWFRDRLCRFPWASFRREFGSHPPAVCMINVDEI